MPLTRGSIFGSGKGWAFLHYVFKCKTMGSNPKKIRQDKKVISRIEDFGIFSGFSEGFYSFQYFSMSNQKFLPDKMPKIYKKLYNKISQL